VVIDQVNNIQFFVPESVVVLHFSKQFTNWGKYSIKDFEKMDNVIVNPARIPTSYATGILLYLHMLNFKAAVSNCNFDVFTLHSSNELFVKPGLSKYLEKYDSGFYQHEQTNRNTEWVPGKSTFRDRKLKKIMNKLQLKNIYMSQVEGTFYNRMIAEKIFNIFEKFNIHGVSGEYAFIWDNAVKHVKNFDFICFVFQDLLRRDLLYAKEEVYFPTIASRFAANIGTPYACINWAKDLLVTKDAVDSIIADTHGFLKQSNMARYQDVFSVKRIERKMDDPLRTYIKSLTKR
jgi:hypothetical protein